ncbi:MAG: energy-coupling factor transporter ATPase [Clostridiales bacterium]|nr:energy-coupling factor transporter ATPase [Clostridiales bacterium]
MSILKTENLSYVYNQGTPFETAAIKNINIDIEKGELVGIIGHTGSGKSTLVQHFNGLLKPTEGKIFVDGVDIWQSKETAKNVKFKVGLCFQYPEYQLFEETVYKDIAFGPKNMKLEESEIDERVKKAADFVGLKPSHLEKSPFDLSGGEKRRVAIAGVMAMEPKILILDEPTAGLDPKGRDVILSLIKDYQKQTDSTVLIVSHSMEDVAKLATKVLVMNKAENTMYGEVGQVYSHADELRNMGLNIPQITQIFSALRKKGIKVSDEVFTIEQAVKELLKYKGGLAQ